MVTLSDEDGAGALSSPHRKFLAEIHALGAIARIVMNLDEFISRR